jgi:hypothetical protein
MPGLSYRGEVDAGGWVLVAGVHPHILHMPNQMSLLILTTEVAPKEAQTNAVRVQGLLGPRTR